MKKRIVSFITALMILLTMPTFFTSVSAQSNGTQIKNIIFMIPDGGGDTLMDLADMVKQAGGFDRAKYPNSTVTDTKPLTLLSYLAGFETTRSANSSVTDSAAGGTALSSGYKTNNGYIGITPNKVPRATILEAAQSTGRAVGIVSTAEWPHATPASYTAHAESRNDYYNIYKQIENKELDVVLGAGYGKVTEFEGATLDNARNAGYKIIRTPAEAESVKPGDKLWGNVSTSNLPTDIQNPAEKASLPELTKAAITALSSDPDGFFLMVEGSWVDSGGHSSNAVTTTSEYLAFDECWKIAVEFAKGRKDTVVLGAPDHDTGGLNLLPDMTNEIAQIRVGTNPSTFTWEGNGNHTGRNCPVWAYLPEGVTMLDGLSPVVGDSEAVRKNYLIDNTDFAPYMASLMGVDLDEISKELFVDVSSIGVYMPSSKRFIFNNGDKYVYPNTDVYYKDGVAIDTHGEVAVYINNKFYVPESMLEAEDWNYKNPENPDIIEGAGTVESPYLIDSVSDFKEFYIGLSTNSYKDVYFKQACDLEFINDSDIGVDDDMVFSGHYDGDGHTIKWENDSALGGALFPTVGGSISNLGITGEIKSTVTVPSASIAAAVTASGRIVNCYSNLNFEGAKFYGIAAKNDGIIHNAYYGGNAKVSAGGKALSEGGSYINCYFVKNHGLTDTAQGVLGLASAEAKSMLVHMLNAGTDKAEADYSVSLAAWECYSEYPEFENSEPVVTRVRLYPETQTVAKGDKFQFTANVDGKYDYSWEINWSIEPQSEFEGTYIDKRGILSIDPNETAKTFTVMAKSKANGGVADASVVTIGSKTVYPEADGSKEKPYLITSEKDFYNFSQSLKNGETYAGKYFKQTRDIDMAGYAGYTGVSGSQRFDGTYDGAGHIINLDIQGKAQHCAFPYTYGTIMNVGTTGKVLNTDIAAGICRSSRETGIMVNCWSTAVSEARAASGICSTGKDTSIFANIYFAGSYKLNAADGGYGSVIANGGKNSNNYYLSDTTSLSKTNSKLTEADMKSVLHNYLNSGRSASATLAGVSEEDLCYWIKIDGGYPMMVELYPYTEEAVDEIEIFPAKTEISKGSGRQLAISGVRNTDVTWTIETSGISSGTTVDKYGFVTVSSDETNAELTVKATLKADTSVTATAKLTLTKSLVPDGSKNNPYIIANEEDFYNFTKKVLGDEKYVGKYFLQTADLDMAGYPGYSGMGGSCGFYGTYNGGGHVINVDIESNDGCIFPYLWGTIINLGTTGRIINDHSAGGVVRSLRAADDLGGPGKVVNCWSGATVSGNYGGGIVPTMRGGIVASCFVFGEVSYTKDLGGIISQGSSVNSFFVSDSHSSSNGKTKVTEQQMKTELAALLNATLSSSAAQAGIDASNLIEWRSVKDSNPVHAIKGDYDGNRSVEASDFFAFLRYFTSPLSEKPDNLSAVLDINLDGKVNLLDLSILLKSLA